MAYIETLDDILNQYADWLGVYGACPVEREEGCDVCPKDANPHCCRVGFMIEQKDRILNAIENEKRFHELITA